MSISPFATIADRVYTRGETVVIHVRGNSCVFERHYGTAAKAAIEVTRLRDRLRGATNDDFVEFAQGWHDATYPPAANGF